MPTSILCCSPFLCSGNFLLPKYIKKILPTSRDLSCIATVHRCSGTSRQIHQTLRKQQSHLGNDLKSKGYLISPLTSIEAGALAARETNDEVVDLGCLGI